MTLAEPLKGVSGEGQIIDLADDEIHEVLRRIKFEASQNDLTFVNLGRRPYQPTWDLQKQIHGWRVAGEIGDMILFVEHEPVYTIGKNAGEEHLLQDYPADAEVIHVDRGGDITYHGPGQLVGYPIVNLQEHKPSVTWLMRGLEGAIIETLATYGVRADQKEGLTGVWVSQRKVAALGVRLSRWTSMHGFAINVDVPDQYFGGIVPCGILEYGVANLNEFLESPTDVLELGRRMSIALTRMLEERIGQVSRLH